ncbi:MAG: hypothetical protein DHS20C18_30700 [Saprospiraceae bacterium]|nr:MAG: hypothetical protein DHS20C18_30700 [Saprospiraceae bacterium]
MGTTYLILGTIVLATILVIVNEHLMKRSLSGTDSIKPGDYHHWPGYYPEEDYFNANDAFFREQEKKNFEELNDLQKERSRLKMTVVFFILLISLLYYFSSV